MSSQRNATTVTRNNSDSFHHTSDQEFKVHNKYIFKINQFKKTMISNDIHVKTVSNFKEFTKFYKLPFYIYRDNPYWVSPFWIEFKGFFKNKNPFWSHSEVQLFLATRKNNTIGRIAAIIDYAYCEKIGNNIGFFGFFECIDDYTCAEALFNSAQDWLQSKNMTMMRGPIDGRIDNGCGFLLSGYDSRSSFMSSYSPPYYISFAEKYEMHKARDQLLYHIDLTKPIPQKLTDKAKQCTTNGIKIRRFNRMRTQKELKWWIDFFLETFSDHWGFVPVSPEEVQSRFGIKQLRWFVDSSLFLIAEKNDVPIAYIWSTPDYNQLFQKMRGHLGPYQFLQFYLMKRTIKTGKMTLIGINKEYRDQGIGSYLNYLTLREMQRR